MLQIKDSLWEKETVSGRDQALFQPLQEDVFWQIDANEHHLAHFHFAIGLQLGRIKSPLGLEDKAFDIVVVVMVVTMSV